MKKVCYHDYGKEHTSIEIRQFYSIRNQIKKKRFIDINLKGSEIVLEIIIISKLLDPITSDQPLKISSP